MKGVYLVTIPKETMQKKYEGVAKKINSHINVFNQEGLPTTLYCYEANKNIILKLSKFLPYNLFISNRKYQKNFDNKDFFYIRKMAFDYPFLKLLKTIKSRNPESKIILEVPTFPYDNENNKLIYLPLKYKDLYYRNKISKYVDRIVTFSKDKEIFNITTLTISNGVEIEQIREKNPLEKKSSEIHVIAVAMLSYWHGYDRFIEGMGEYYKDNKSRNIVFHIVGDGDVITHYKNLVRHYGIEKRVVFHGKKSGSELNDIYNISDIALDAMGRHRSGVYYNSSLKGKEYLAKGIPIVSGVKTELDEDKSFEYYLKIPSDDSAVRIQDIIMFYDGIYKDKEVKDIVKVIRSYAETNFDMKQSMKPVVHYLKKKNGNSYK